MENFSGLMEENIEVDGKMDNNMEEAYMSELMELKNKENGD